MFSEPGRGRAGAGHHGNEPLKGASVDGRGAEQVEGVRPVQGLREEAWHVDTPLGRYRRTMVAEGGGGSVAELLGVRVAFTWPGGSVRGWGVWGGWCTGGVCETTELL